MTGRMRGVAYLVVVGLALAAALVSSAAAAASTLAPMGEAAGALPPLERVLTLQDVVTMARQRHPDIVKADAALRSAERDLAAQEAAYSVRVTLDSTPLSLSLQRGRLTRSPLSLRLSTSQNTSVGLNASASLGLSIADDLEVSVPTWNVGLSYPLFRSPELNSTNLAIRAAQINLESARRQRVRAEGTAIVQTIELYRNAYLAEIRLREAQEAFAQAQERYETVLRQRAIGIASEADRINAEAELRRQQLTLTQAERAYRNQMEALLKAIGASDEPPDAYRLAEWPKLARPAVDRDDAAWLEEARAFDPSLWQQAVAVETAELQLRAERERSRFDASLSASVGKGRETDPADTQVRWSVQVQLSYPLADGGARAKSLHEREEGLRNAEQAYQDEIRAFEQRMRQLREALDDAWLQMEIAELTYEKARLDFASAQAAYSVGMTTAADLQAVERALERAAEDLQTAILAVYIALWNMEIAAGHVPDLSVLFAS